MKYLSALALLLLPFVLYASPVSVNRLNNDHIEPLNINDFIKARYFTGTSTTATSTFPNASSSNFTVSTSFNFLGTAITNVSTWFNGLFNTQFATKTTDNLTQGATNLYNQTHTGEVTGATTLTVADDVIDEANLKINTPIDNYLLTASSTAPGGLAWTSSTTVSSLLQHNSLAGLQGGTTNEYYHLTSANASLVNNLDSNLATFALPANTTISTYGKSLVDDSNSTLAVQTLGLDTDLQTMVLQPNLTIATGTANSLTYYSGTNTLSGATTGTGVLTALGVNVGTAGAFVVNGGALGTPSSGTLTSATGLPISTGVSGLGSGIATWLATPSSANLATAVTDETGSGALMFGTSPTITTSLIGASSAFPTLGNTTLANKLGNVYLGTTGDVYPKDDIYPLWDRFVNYGFTPDETWRQNTDELSWVGYATYSGFGTPSNITTTLSAYSSASSSSAGSLEAFRYRNLSAAATSTNIVVRSRLTISYNATAGVRLDDGTNNNFYQAYIIQSATGGAWSLVEQYRTGGGAVTTNTAAATMPYGQFLGLGIRCLGGPTWTSYTCNPFTFGEAQKSVQFTSGTGAMSWTPVRTGLYSKYQLVDFGSRAIWDWYDEASS